MSVQSVTLGYAEVCEKSHEFVRRGCSKTPKGSYWAGDLLVITDEVLKQSDVMDVQGEESDVVQTYNAPADECSDVVIELPEDYTVEETSIRTGGKQSFSFLVPKNENEEEETNWELDIYQSTGGSDYCGLMGFDGGDALQYHHETGKVMSICGTVIRNGSGEAKAHYLDNRKSHNEDSDNGLLVCIRTGNTWVWEMRYAPHGLDLSSGLASSDNVSSVFAKSLADIGMTYADVFEFGMI